MLFRSDAFYSLWREETDILQTQFLSDLEVHAILGIVHIGMHGDDADTVHDGFHHRTLHVRQVADGLQSSEQQRMVTDNQVAALTNGLINDVFVDVQTQ